jgi:hypothetical protein
VTLLTPPPPRAQPLLDGVEELHCFVVLNYIGARAQRAARALGARCDHAPSAFSLFFRVFVPFFLLTFPFLFAALPRAPALFKLVKKYNKLTRAPRHARLAALPLLLASPLFHSRPLQLLFQRAAKWRHEGSQHGGGAALAMAAAAAAAERASNGLSSPMKAAGGLPMSPLRPRGVGVPIFGGASLRLSAGGEESYHGSAGSLLGGECGGPVSPSAAPVRCEGCVRGQTRFVVLGCAHTFCWGCVAASLVRQRRLLARQASGPGPGLGGGGGGGSGRGSNADLSAPSPDAAAAAPQQQPPQPLPPTAGLLSRRLSATADAPWSGVSGSAPGGSSASLHGLATAHSFGASAAALLGDAAACEPALLECPVCDAMHNLDDGHLEVNPLSGDAGCYVWMLAPAEGRMSRRNPSRSRLAGMDFASLSVYGSVGSSPKFGGMHGGVLHGDGGMAAHSVGAGAPGGSGWPKGIARVPSWNSLTMLARPA